MIPLKRSKRSTNAQWILYTSLLWEAFKGGAPGFGILSKKWKEGSEKSHTFYSKFSWDIFQWGKGVFVFMSKLFRHKIVTNFVSISDGHIPLTNDSS